MSQGTKTTYFEEMVFMSFVPKTQMHNFHVLIGILVFIKLYFSGMFSSKTSDNQMPDPLYQMPNSSVFL